MCKARTNTKNDDKTHNIRSKRRVTFHCALVQVHPFLSFRSELSEAEFNELWFTKSELDAAMQEILETLTTWREKSSATKNVDICVRGLEQETDRARKVNVIRAAKALLEEQKRQKSMGINDPEELARVFRIKTIYSQETALRMAQEDRRVADMALAELKSPRRESLFKTLGRALQDIEPTSRTPKSSPAGGSGERKHIKDNSPVVKRKSGGSKKDMLSLWNCPPRIKTNPGKRMKAILSLSKDRMK